jgi:uncharacterized lipoprotein YmbA
MKKRTLRITNPATYITLLLAAVICGCGKKNAPAPVAPLGSTQPPVATPGIQPNVTVVPSKKPAQLAEVLDLTTLMNRIPTNEFALSENEGWDKFTMPKVQKWVRSNLYGKRGRLTVCMLRCSLAQRDAEQKPDEWTVSLEVAGIHANYAGMPNRILPTDKEDQTDHSPSMGTWGKASFACTCTEAEARKWDAHSKTAGAAVTVEGDVAGIALQPHLGGEFSDFFIGYDTFVQLDSVVLRRSNDTEPGVLYALESAMALHGSLREPEEVITEIRRLDSSGNYQLILLKNYRWDSKGKRFEVNLFPVSLAAHYSTFDDSTHFIRCDDPPTESQIAAAKEKIGWRKD